MTDEDEEFNRIERESKMRKQAVESALNKMSENARELGLDYEPAGGTQVSKVWWDGEKLMAKPIPLEAIYKPAPMQEKVAQYSDIVSDGGLDPRNNFDTTPPAQQQSESAYQRGYMDGMAKGRRDAATDAAEKQKTNYLNGYCTGRTELLAEQAKQNPVAWMVYTLDGTSVCVTDNPEDFTNEHRALPLYAYPEPAKQPAVPLTNGEIYTAYITATNQTLRPQDERLALAFARAIEAAIKEKNT